MPIEDTINKLSQDYFDSIILKVKRIYVDMELLQDFKLGALLSVATVKEEIDYIKSQMVSYNSRFDLDTAKHFPVLNKSEEELSEIMKNNSLKVAMLSPWTIIYNNFNSILKFLYINAHNTQEKVQNIDVVVNCSDMVYPKKLFEVWKKEMDKMHPYVNLSLQHVDRYVNNFEFYNNFDMFFLYEHHRFFNTDGLVSYMMQNNKNKEFKIVYAPPFIEDKLKLDPTEYSKALESTKAFLNLMFDFFYMPNGVQF